MRSTTSKRILILGALWSVGCGGSPTAPTPPVTVSPPPAPTPPVTVVPPVVVPPPAVVTPPAPTPVPDPFPPNDARFNLTLYRQLVHNAFEGPLQPLRRFTQAPRIYLRIVDEDGKPIDSRILEDTARSLEEAAAEMTGKFGLAGIERGTAHKIGERGWLTVRWLPQASNPQRVCGQARVGAEGSSLDLFPYQIHCECDRYALAPHVVKHELGHALGFWHTDRGDDLMYGGHWDPALCNAGMTARERYHAALAYDRPIGSAAP